MQTMQIDGYKCPNCGGTVKFDSSSQAMKCPFCDTEFELAALEEHQKEISAPAQDDYNWGTQDSCGSWGGEDMDCLSSGSCPSCGAELFGNENTVAAVCPCCGNAQIIVKRLTGGLKPDYVIPFKLEKKAAVEAINNFCKGKRLLPDCFLKNNHIQDTQGLYAPFWLFDANAHGHVNYKATKVRVWRKGDYNYKEISHYSVLRDGNLDFEKIPVDASEKMDSAYMDAMEPFNYKEMKDFHNSFLAGYAAEKYDVDADKSKPRAERRIKTTLEKEFKKSVNGYATVTQVSSSVNAKNGRVSYGLFPVWVLNTKYRQENYQFMMNGQTGQLVGKLPVDKAKTWKYRGAITGILGVIMSAVMFGLHAAGLVSELIDFDPSLFSMIAFAWILSLTGGIGTVEYWKYKMNTARPKNNACEYMVQGSLSFRVQKDSFLYKTVTKTPCAVKAAAKAGAAATRKRR